MKCLGNKYLLNILSGFIFIESRHSIFNNAKPIQERENLLFFFFSNSCINLEGAPENLKQQLFQPDIWCQVTFTKNAFILQQSSASGKATWLLYSYFLKTFLGSCDYRLPDRVWF